MKDIVCINQGLFTAFIPQTTAGEAVFNAMVEDTQGTPTQREIEYIEGVIETTISSASGQLAFTSRRLRNATT